MKKIYLFIVVLLIGNFILSQALKHTPTDKEQTLLTQSLRGNGMRFTPNKGQIVDMDGKFSAGA